MRPAPRSDEVRELETKGNKLQADSRYEGLYRGTCVINVDPYALRRIKVRIEEFYGPDPKVFGNGDGIPSEMLPWALPCLSPNAIECPAVGDTVWVMFEKGHVEHPIWMGIMYPAPEELSNPDMSPPGWANK